MEGSSRRVILVWEECGESKRVGMHGESSRESYIALLQIYPILREGRM